MVKFLLKRPIAVLMAFTACLILGLVTYFTLPVSLLPDIAIPHITVQINEENSSARELENTVVTPVRRQLLQVTGLREIKSETRDGSAVMHLEFDFGINTDLAFIEVNEKIDAAMNSLPKSVSRPKAIKASATDIPVLYLNMTLRDNNAYEEPDEQQFLDMCEVAANVVRRRIEQLPEIAMADVTGIPGRFLRIVPDQSRMAMAGVTVEDIENALLANNAEPGSMMVCDGYYEYNIHISNQLRTAEDVENIRLRKADRIMQLKDFCSVAVVSQGDKGYSISDGKRAVTLAIIKQSEENMDKMKESLRNTTDYFSRIYPQIEFKESRNQTELLDYTISNLQQNLLLGLLLVFLVTALFMGDLRSPFIIGLSIIVAIIITFLLFYLFGVSINVISLSGLILAVGMMIDNSVIVTENITQYRNRGFTLNRSCVMGTNEMITPMLSSSLTTIAVFVPLIFMSGIAGAIFTDQAFSITAGLAVSYITGITLLPVLYLLFNKIGVRRNNVVERRLQSLRNHGWMERAYDRGIDWVFSHKALCLIASAAVLPLCVIMFGVMKRERMPQIDQNETLMRVEWNENINVDENARRVNLLARAADTTVVEHAAYAGTQDYLLNSENELSASEAELYFKTRSSDDIAPLRDRMSREVAEKYPMASVGFAPPENIFEKIFSTGEADIEARVYPADRSRDPGVDGMKRLEQRIASSAGVEVSPIPLRDQINISIDREKLLIYRVDFNEVQRTLRTAFKGNTVSTLRSYQQYLPIGIAGRERNINEILNQTLVSTMPDDKGEVSHIPLGSLVDVTRGQDLKSIMAGSNGEYIPLAFYDVSRPEQLMEDVREAIAADNDWDVDFAGSFFSNEKMMQEMVIILLISILLMYFILCAQFESFLQPLIVLLEIPIDTAFALVTLWVFGHTLNLMSAIGIIVTCGIVVNDSILKLDAINELRKQGVPLMQAIHTAGCRRLRAIIMTSLTTIFAMVPLLFTSDMGSELQRPLAVAMIGSMIVGTLVSIFIIPLIYWIIYRKHHVAVASHDYENA